MGRASRRKRKRPRQPSTGPAAAPGPAPGRRSARRRLLLAIAGLVALALAVVLGSRLLDRRPSDPAPAPPSSPQETILPDPDTSAMTPPVARAIREARQGALARPASAAAVGHLGQLLHAHWLLDDAAECYEIARRLAPEEFRWAYLLAGVEEIRGADGERVDRLFREAIRLAPGHAPAYVRRADALMRLGRWGEASDLYREGAARDPQLVLAHRGLGQALTLLGDGAAAVAPLERAGELAPEDRITRVALARAYTLAGRADDAEAASRRAGELTGEASIPDQIFFEVQNLAVDPESLRARIRRRFARGAVDAALADLALLEESEGPGARLGLAAAAKQRANQLAFAGELERALPEFERASRLAPDDPEIEHNWGTVLLRRGELEAAGRHFEKAIALDPSSADSLYNLGVVLEGLGRPKEAIERFRQAAAIEPQHVAAGRLAELGVAVNP